MSLVEINQRWPIVLPIDRAEQWDIWHASGGWERERLDAVHAAFTTVHGDNPPCVYDIGAELGDLTGLYATWGARIVAVEPTPGMWPHIREVFELNNIAEHIAGCFVGFCAAESTTGWDRDFVAGPWPAWSRGARRSDPGFGHLNETPGDRVTLDELVATIGEPPSIVTVDVEGSELEVLRGAVWTLSMHRPDVFVSIHPDFMADRYGQTPVELHDWMEQAGYESVFLAEDHEEHFHYIPEERA